MRRLISCGLIIALNVAVMSAVTASAVVASDSRSPCMADTRRHAQPRLMLKGERIQITMSVRPVCPQEVYPLHIVLVLDRSESMAPTKIEHVKAAAADLVRRLKREDEQRSRCTRFGVVAFDWQAVTLVPPSDDEGRVLAAIDGIRVARRAGTAIDKGIDEGLKNLIEARQLAPQRSQVHEAMILFSDGLNDADCPPVLLAAARAKAQGVLLVTVCVGDDCNEACLRQAASATYYHYRIEDWLGMLAIFGPMPIAGRDMGFERLVVTDTLPANVRYVEDGAAPPPTSVSPDGDVLRWEADDVPTAGVTITYWVEPLDAGYWPTTVGAELAFLDNKGRKGSATFPIPWVQVLMPKPVIGRP